MKLHTRLQYLKGPLDMTPMMDVILLLLIFFMLSSSFILQPGIKVELPQSRYGPGAQANRLIVSLVPDPQKTEPLIFFNDQLMTSEQLQAALKAAAAGRPSQSLVIKSDKGIAMGTVVDVMNLAMSHGLSVIIATQRPHGAGQP